MSNNTEASNRGIGFFGLLAVLSQMVGMTIALQDQSVMRPCQALDIVQKNIEIGNKSIVDNLMNNTGGTA